MVSWSTTFVISNSLENLLEAIVADCFIFIVIV